MASPAGHYLLGLTIIQALARNEKERKQGVLLASVALLPDLDIVAGVLSGYIWRYHHGLSHSLGMAVLVAAVALAALIWRRSESRHYLALSVFLIYGSHVALDYVSLDTGRLPGVPLFWPLISERFVSPWLLLPYAFHAVGPVISLHNVLVVLREMFLFGPLVALVYMLRSRPRTWPEPVTWIFGGLFVLAAWATIFAT